MTEGSIYQRQSDGRWVAQFKDTTGKTKYIYRKTKDDAKQALQEAIKDRNDGIIPASKMTVGMYLEEWLADRRDTVSRRTWVNQESLIRVHVKPHIASVRLSKLSGNDITKLYRQKRADGLAAATVRQVHAILNQAMNDAVRLKYIRHNPLDEVKPPRLETKELDVLSKKQLLHLLDSVQGDRCEMVFVLGALCGLRIGEALGLRWDDVDLERGTLQVRRTVWRGKVFQPKTASSRRTLTLPQRALEALVRLRSKSDGQGYLFPTRGGVPVAASNFHTHHWVPAIRRAGMPNTLTFHKLRHGAASLLLNEGVPVPVVSRYLGHANPGITMKVYAHVLDGTSHVAASAMDNILG